jgi:hypothetical protein
MQKRTNDKFDQVVNKGLMISQFRGSIQASKMMARAGLPSSIILRVLTTPQNTRSTDWR